MHVSRKLLTTVASALLTICFAVSSSAGRIDAQTNDTLHIVLFPAFNNLPIYLAMDKGYFAQEHLDVQISKINTAPSALAPMLARDDVDIAPVQLSPAFFNQYQQGFNIHLVASIAGPKQGWHDTVYFVVRQELWDSGHKTLADLKGKTVDVAGNASTLDFIFRRALEHYKLSMNDFVVTRKFRTPPDWFVAFQNKAVDAMPIVEPMATQMEMRGTGHKIFSVETVAPWYQDTFIAVAPAFARDHHATVVRFLRALLHGQRDVLAAGGKWTPDLIAEVSKWTEVPPEVIQQMGGPAYTGDLGRISIDSISRQQAFYVEQGAVQKAVPVAELIDGRFLDEAKAQP